MPGRHTGLGPAGDLERDGHLLEELRDDLPAGVRVHAPARPNLQAVAANINAPDQTVISGDPDAVTRAGEACKKRGAKRVIPLKVSGAFHSPLMGPAQNHLQLALERAEFADPAFPVIANATAEAVKDAGRARRLLADQLTTAVRWVECMEHAARMGGEDARFIEIGPGQVLASLLKRKPADRMEPRLKRPSKQ